MNFKLAILGRAFSGKKAVAKVIQDKLNPSGIKVFSIDKMIHEAIEYVQPKDEHTIVSTDAKSKPKKGVVEEKHIDPFDGKDSENYKLIAEELRQKLTETS